jgi:uncharacterized protein (TIGR01244 family)
MHEIAHYSINETAASFAGSLVGFGGVTPVSAMPWLKNTGFTTVINLRGAGEEGVDIGEARAAAEAAGLNYVHLAFNPMEPAPGLLEQFMSTVGDQAKQPVYIHCASATRVAALWMLVRILKDNWDMGRASEEAETIAHKPAEAVGFVTAYMKARE